MSNITITMEQQESDVDKSQMPPLQKKRILAFVNHFLINSSTFLSRFALTCEAQLIKLERKIQKLETALSIIEAKLDSLPESDSLTTLPNSQQNTFSEEKVAITPLIEAEEANASDLNDSTSDVRASDDVRYKKFFKMVQFGVPPAAVKLKMQAEGLDASILDTPEIILADGIQS